MRYNLTIRLLAILFLGFCGFLPAAVSAAPGDLDTTFSSDGIIRETVGISSRDEIYGTVIQPDGKIVVAGFVVFGNSIGCGIARYNADGSFDTSFGGDGKVIALIGRPFECYDVALQTDGKIVAAGYVSGSLNFDFAVVRYNPDGSPDMSFGSGGKVTTDLLSGVDIAGAVAIQADGKIVVAGRSMGATEDFAVVRYNPTGSLDTSFDGDGIVKTDVLGGVDHARTVVIQPDGKILVGGNSSAGSSTNDFAVVRYNPDGSLDTSFDTDGRATTPILASHDNINALAVQTDGKIIAAGQSLTGNIWKISLVRYNPTGSLDTSFDTDGILTTSVSDFHDYAYAVAVQSDGKIVVAGSSSGSISGFTVVRYNPTGSLDTSFDGDGKATTSILSEAQAYSMAIQADGRIVAAGACATDLDRSDFAIARYNATGSLDTSFDGDGKKTNSLGSGNSTANATVIQPDGKIIVVGNGHNGADYDFAVVRYNPNGSLDTSFGGGDGKVLTDLLDYFDFGYAVALQPDGKIIVGGSASGGSALARYNADGSLDKSFDGDGKLTIDISSTDAITAIAVQADGKIVTAGYSLTGTYDFTVLRFNPNGSFDTSFDGDGIATTDILASNDYGSSLAIQADGKIVVAGSCYTSNKNSDFAILRYNADGSLDASFDGDGKVLTEFSGAVDGANALALQADGKIVATGNSGNGSDFDFAVARYNPTGALDTSFGGDGKATTPVSSGTSDVATSVAIQADGRIITAGYSTADSLYDIAILRYNADGSIDGSYGTGGKAVFDFSNEDRAYDIALDSIGRAVVAGELGGLFSVVRILGDAPPPAVSVSVSGRLLRANGNGIFNGFITITDSAGNTRFARTNPFGYYRFYDIPGGTITISVSSKSFSFANPTRVITLTDNVGNLDFTAIE